LPQDIVELTYLFLVCAIHTPLAVSISARAHNSALTDYQIYRDHTERYPDGIFDALVGDVLLAAPQTAIISDLANTTPTPSHHIAMSCAALSILAAYCNTVLLADTAFRHPNGDVISMTITTHNNASAAKWCNPGCIFFTGADAYIRLDDDTLLQPLPAENAPAPVVYSGHDLVVAWIYAMATKFPASERLAADMHYLKTGTARQTDDEPTAFDYI
jgi:hypothetical protein